METVKFEWNRVVGADCDRIKSVVVSIRLRIEVDFKRWIFSGEDGEDVSKGATKILNDGRKYKCFRKSHIYFG